MRLHIVAVGRLRKGAERDLYEAYAARIRWPLALREVEEKRPLSVGKRKAREAELLLGAVPQNAVVTALDEGGRNMASTAFAEWLAGWQDAGRGDVAFLVGGADGLDRAVLDRADLVLSFGVMTWPHLLVRAMLAEQLYRAQQILAGHPYHRE